MEIGIGLLGCGTVGQAVVKLLNEKGAHYARRTESQLVLHQVLVKNAEKPREGLQQEQITTDPDQILENPDIQVVIEVMGGVEESRDYLLKALHGGKHVVTANKALMAKHGAELFDAATENGCALYYEAAVAGGIPIIQTLKRSLASNALHSVYGIINGTTNYILSAMTEAGRGFDEVLAEAQHKGFAESDPTDDIEGYDAVYKLAILASLIFEQRIPVDAIHRVGIQRISAQDIAHAKELGYVIKLLAIAKRGESGFEARVPPTMIPIHHPLASVNGVYNALLVQGDAVGDLMFYGQGAGGLPTASAVVSDLLNIVVEMDAPPNLLMSCQHPGEEAMLAAADQVMNRYYLRLQAEDRTGVLGQLGVLMGQAEMIIHTLTQKKNSPGQAELVLITHPVSELKLRQVVAKIQQLDIIHSVDSIIRVEDFTA